MMKKFSLLALILAGLSACATTETATEAEAADEPENLNCVEDRELGSPNTPTKVCRGY